MAWVVAVGAACGEPTIVRIEPPSEARAGGGMVAETWTYSDLGSIGAAGASYFSTEAVNDSGQIAGVGWSALGPVVVAWRWHNYVFQQTAAIDSSWGGGYGINNRGDVFGTLSTDNIKWTNMIWHFEPGYSVEGSFARHTKGAREEGEDINDAGYAVGYNCVPLGAFGNCQLQALLWRPSQAAYPWRSTPIVLGPLGDDDRAFAINNVATALGHTSLDGDNRAWIKTLGGSMQALPLGATFSESWPGDINDSDVSVGVARNITTDRYRFVKWIGTSRPIDLGIFLDADRYPNQRAPVRISNKGRIAGHSQNMPFTFMSGTLTLLPVPVGATATVAGINTCGDIVGTVGYPANGGHHLIRWQRVELSMHVCD